MDPDLPARWRDEVPTLGNGAEESGTWTHDELRSKLDILAPGDEDSVARARAAADALGGAIDRIEGLERSLAEFRAREEALVARATSDRHEIIELRAQVAELSAVANATTDAALADVQARAALAAGHLELLDEHVTSLTAENERLTTRCAELERELQEATAREPAWPIEPVGAAGPAGEPELFQGRALEPPAVAAARLGLETREGVIQALAERLEILDRRIQDLTLGLRDANSASQADPWRTASPPEAAGQLIDLRDDDEPIVTDGT